MLPLLRGVGGRPEILLEWSYLLHSQGCTIKPMVDDTQTQYWVQVRYSVNLYHINVIGYMEQLQSSL